MYQFLLILDWMNKHKVRVSCRAIIRDNDSLFLLKQKHIERNNEVNEFWSTVGGGLDPGESLVDNLKREIKEELGVINVDVGRLLYVQQFKGYGCEHLEFFFEVLNSEDFKNIDLNATTHGLDEIETYGFVDPNKEFCLPKFLSKVINEMNDKKTVFPRFINYL